MGRKSTIDKLDGNVRTHKEKRIRENKLTLDELIADLQQTFPAKDKPSRSALSRYRQNFESMISRMREQETMARILVEELGENPDDKAGALMVQSLTTLVNQAVFEAQDRENMDIDDIRKLARAAKDAIQARQASLNERQQIEKITREKLLAEQKQKLAAMPVKSGVTEDTKQAIREALGIE